MTDEDSPRMGTPLDAPIGSMRLWMAVVPDIANVRGSDRKSALDQAKRTPLTSNEVIVIAAWLFMVFVLVQSVLTRAPDDARLAAALIANVFVGIPLLLLVYVPIHIRRIRRGIRQQLGG